MSSTHRNVSQKEVYDSFLGILRLSPNTDAKNIDGELLDEATAFLTDVDASKTGIQGLQLSDSSGIGLPHYFVPRVFRTNIISEEGIITQADVILQENFIPTLYPTKKLKIKSTLLLNDISDGKSPIGVLFQKEGGATNEYELLSYPINNPYYKNYFNDRGKLASTSITDKDRIVITETGYNGERSKQLKAELKKKSPEWYKNTDYIKNSEWVVANGKNIFYSNEDGKAIPALHTHDFILGSYDSHTFVPSDKNLTGFDDNKKVRITKETKLSWIDVDKLIWDIASDCLGGTIRHASSRYSGFINIPSGLENVYGPVVYTEASDGVNPSFSVSSSEREDNGLMGSAMLLGQEVQIGTMISHAVPLRRLLFWQEKQKLYNIQWAPSSVSGTVPQPTRDLYNAKNTINNNKKNNDGNFAPMERMVNSVANYLPKNFLICDGQKVSVANYPYMNIFNYNLFGNWSSTNILPEMNTSHVMYDALKKSLSSDGSVFMTPAIFSKNDGYNPTFIRGAQWDLNYENLIPNCYIKTEEEAKNEKYNVISNTYQTTTVPTKHITYRNAMPASASANYVMETAKWEFGDLKGDLTKLVKIHNFNRFIQVTDNFLETFGSASKYYVYNNGSYDIMGSTLTHYHKIFSKVEACTNTAPTMRLAHYKDNTRPGLTNNPFGVCDLEGTNNENSSEPRNGIIPTSSYLWWDYNKNAIPSLYENYPIRNYYATAYKGKSDLNNYPDSNVKNFIKNEEREALMVASCHGGYKGKTNELGLYVKSGYEYTVKRSKTKWPGKWFHEYKWGGFKPYNVPTNNSYYIGAETGAETRCLTSLPYQGLNRLGYFEDVEKIGSFANQLCYPLRNKRRVPCPPAIFLIPLIRI